MTKYNNQSDLSFCTNSRKDDYTKGQEIWVTLEFCLPQTKNIYIYKYHNTIKLLQHRNKKDVT